jgi:putative ABC transport system permease protein
MGRHLFQILLMVVGIALGVAVVVGVDIANESANRAFNLSAETVTGRTTHVITGGPQGLDETVYSQIRTGGLGLDSAPVISDYVTSPQLGDVTLQLLGVDPFAEPPFRNYLAGEGSVPVEDLVAFLTRPGAVLLSKDFAGQYNLGVGSRIQLVYGGNEVRGFVAGLLQPGDNFSKRALEGVVLADIATAQEITGRIGKLDRIDLILPGESDVVLRELRELMPPNGLISPIEARNGAVQQMTKAFRVNLTALSLLALVVGLFLIYNTMTFSVVQRRSLFGILRSLGVTRGEVFVLVIGEALILGVLGASLGLLLGTLMGRGTVRLVSQTINDLFFVITVSDFAIPTASLVKGGLLGVIATVVTAAFPAWEAASVPPQAALLRSGLELKAARIVYWVAVVGLCSILGGCGVLLIPTRDLVISFAGTFMIVIGFAMLTPEVTSLLMGATSRLTGRIWGALGRMAPREVVNSLSRTAIAISALMVAVSVTIGVSLMVGSFRFTVITWLDQILHGDIYISAPRAGANQPATPIDPQALTIIENWEGVKRVDLLRSALVDSPYGPIRISANNNPDDGVEQVYFSADYPPKEIWEAVKNGAVLVSEPLANRLELPKHGGEIEMNTNEGPQTFPVAGIYNDYASSQGTVILWLDNYRQLWDDEQITAVALLLEQEGDLDQSVDALRDALKDEQDLIVRPNQALREDTLEIFDRTFAITRALQLMTTVVAFVGVLGSLMSLQLDKQRQMGILKAIGLTSKQLWGMIALETGLMGAVAGLLAMPTGYVLAIILIYIINRRSFGWSLQMSVTAEPFLQALVIAVVAALLAGMYPALRIINRKAADAIRFD